MPKPTLSAAVYYNELRFRHSLSEYEAWSNRCLMQLKSYKWPVNHHTLPVSGGLPAMDLIITGAGLGRRCHQSIIFQKQHFKRGN